VFPETGNISTGDAELDREREELRAMGGITYYRPSILFLPPAGGAL
jgi:hypothetical protein